MKVPQILKIELLHDPALPLLSICPKEMKTLSQRDLHSHVHCSIIHNSQNMAGSNLDCMLHKENISYIYMCVCVHTHAHTPLYVAIYIYAIKYYSLIKKKKILFVKNGWTMGAL